MPVGPGTAAMIAVGAGATALIAAPAALTVAGFSTTGVVGGSIAAGIQSAVYGGATAGFFSSLQSIGVLGLGLAGQAYTAAGGAATALGILALL